MPSPLAPLARQPRGGAAAARSRAITSALIVWGASACADAPTAAPSAAPRPAPAFTVTASSVSLLSVPSGARSAQVSGTTGVGLVVGTAQYFAYPSQDGFPDSQVPLRWENRQLSTLELPTGARGAFALGVGSDGTVAGSADYRGRVAPCGSSVSFHCAVVWRSGAPIVLDAASEAFYERAVATTGGNIAAGHSVFHPDEGGSELLRRAVRWTGTVPTLLPAPAGVSSRESAVTALAADGTAFGWIRGASSYDSFVPVAWPAAGGAAVLPLLAGETRGQVAAVSAGGVAVGWSAAAGRRESAVTWTGGAVRALPLPAGAEACIEAAAISADGSLVAGTCMLVNGVRHATAWVDGVATILGPGKAFAVADDGTVVGVTHEAAYFGAPAMWTVARALTPAEQVAEVTADVAELALLAGLKTGLTAKLADAAAAIAAGDTAAACTALQDFSNQTNALAKAGKLTPADAAGLVDAATKTWAALGC